MTTAKSRIRPSVSPPARPLPAISTTIPNAASGRTAAAMRPTVRRVRNDRLSPKPSPESSSKVGPGSADAGQLGRRAGRDRSAIGLVDAASRGGCAVDRVVSHRPPAGPPRRAGSRSPDRLEVDRPIRVDLDLLAETPHRDPDVGGVGVLGVRPAPRQERLGRDGLADVRGEGVEEPRLGRRQLDASRPTVASRRWRSRVRSGPRTRLWRGTLSPSRRRTRLIRARSSG